MDAHPNSIDDRKNVLRQHGYTRKWRNRHQNTVSNGSEKRRQYSTGAIHLYYHGICRDIGEGMDNTRATQTETPPTLKITSIHWQNNQSSQKTFN